MVIFDTPFWDSFIPDKYEGSAPIPKDAGPNPRTGQAECPMHPYTASTNEYYVKIAAGPASAESMERFRGVDYPLYVTKTSYQEDKIYDGRTMQDCLANDVERSQKWTDLSPNWAVEPIVAVQMARYTFRTHKTAINAQGAGVGITFKYYPDSKIIAAGDREEVDHVMGKDAHGNPIYEEDDQGNRVKYEKFEGQKDIRRIKPACRASSFDQTNETCSQFHFYRTSNVCK